MFLSLLKAWDGQYGNSNKKILQLAKYCWLAWSLGVGVLWAQEDTFVILAHKDAPFDNATQNELSRLYLMVSDSLGGNRAMPLNLRDQELKYAFLGKLTGKSRRTIERHFLGFELRGEALPPLEVDSVSELVKRFLQNKDREKSMVAWLPVRDLKRIPEAVKAFLKFLTVDGKSYQDSGYLLAN